VWEFRKRGELQTWSENGEKHFPSRYAVKTTTSPAQIDIITIDGTALGIYRVKGDRLEMCLACPGVERPTRFEVRYGGGREAVAEFRDFWRSLPQLGKEFPSAAEECDDVLAQLKQGPSRSPGCRP
jgi:hypothetical protein